jgi:signal transduction histidine kinase/FixJ family two-component response regulator
MNSLLARLLMVVAIALVPVLAFQGYTEADARRVRQQLMEEEALRLVHLVSFEQQRIIDGAEQVLDVIGGAPAVQDNTLPLCQRLLANLLRQSPRYAFAAVIGLDGHVVCSPDPANIGVDLSDRPYFQNAMRSGDTAIGEYVVGRGSGKPSIGIAKPYRNRDGTIAGVVEVSLDLRWLGEQLAGLALPPGGSARVADHNGIILARHTDNARYIGQPILAENRFTLEGNEIAVRAAHGFDGRTFLVAYAPPDAVRNGLAVLVGLDPEVSFAAITRANRTGLWLIVAGGGLALVLTGLVGHRLIRRPVTQLLNAAADWRTGALTVRTRLPKDSSEFGRLGIALDEMATALETRERALRTALESTTDYVMVIDDHWCLTYVNGSAKTYIGDRDVIGQPFWEVFPHLAGTALAECCRTAMERRLPGRIEMRSERTLRYFDTNVYPSDGGVTLYARDVTEARRVAAALQESETRLQLAKEAAGFGVWDWDMTADTMVWSEQNWRLYGRTPREQGPDKEVWRSWLHTADRDRVIAGHAAARDDPGRALDCEFRVVWPDGTVHWLSRKGTVVCDASGKPIRMVGLNMDITASRETEDALRRMSSDLEQRVIEEVAAREAAQARAAQAERMQALGQLAGGIAHDFNNVLQVVSGAISLIARRAPGDAAMRRLTKIADEATERGASITRRLLAFGRRDDLHVETLDVADLLRGLHEMLSHTLGASIAVQVRMGSNLCPIMADRRQLETVLVNLATNARDAMPGGGRLILSADIETMPDAAPGHSPTLAPGLYVRLSVTDTGTGMDAETLARAREPFFTTKTLGAGTGLGLSMAQGFAEQSDGALSIDSHPGEGTTVTLWLPRAQGDLVAQTPSSQTATSPVTEPASHGRILLVDDESMVREVLTEFLEDAGYVVMAAADGMQALALLDTGPAIAAVVTDLSMPGMDGLAVIRAAQERYPSLPAVLLTGYAGEDAAMALGTSIAGPVSLLRKPIRSVELLDSLAAMLAARRDTETVTRSPSRSVRDRKATPIRPVMR